MTSEAEVCRMNTNRAPSFAPLDRKSTRLNSSHPCISYAILCCAPTPWSHDLALHDALPICLYVRRHVIGPFDIVNPRGIGGCEAIERAREIASHIGIGIFLDDQRSRSVPHEHEQGTVLRPARSEEHTSELQSPMYLVCHSVLCAHSVVSRPCPTRRSSDLSLRAPACHRALRHREPTGHRRVRGDRARSRDRLAHRDRHFPG